MFLLTETKLALMTLGSHLACNLFLQDKCLNTLSMQLISARLMPKHTVIAAHFLQDCCLNTLSMRPIPARWMPETLCHCDPFLQDGCLKHIVIAAHSCKMDA